MLRRIVVVVFNEPIISENHQYGGGASAISTTTTTGVEDFERDIWPQIVDGNAFENQLIVLNFLPTGCEGIDDVLAGGTSETGESLGGGLRQGQVTEITGECGSGRRSCACPRQRVRQR